MLTKEYIRRLSGSRTYNKGIEVYNEGKVVPFSAEENQATDRAHRIGQKNTVNVYKLIAKDTIEENIVKLQEKKHALADQILSGEDMGSGSFTKEEILELISK